MLHRDTVLKLRSFILQVKWKTCLYWERKCSWQQHQSCIPHWIQIKQEGMLVPQTGRHDQSEAARTLDMSGLWGRWDSVEMSSQNDILFRHERTPPTEKGESFQRAAPTEAWADQRLHRAPSMRATWAYSSTISFYFGFYSASGL